MGSTINRQNKKFFRYLLMVIVVVLMVFRITMRVCEVGGVIAAVWNVTSGAVANVVDNITDSTGYVAAAAAVEKPEAKDRMDRAVFAWEGVDKKGLKVLEEHAINTVLLDYNHSKDIKKLRSYNTLILAGDSSWTASDLKRVVDEAAELNADGVVFDIESDYQALASHLEALESLNTESLPVYVCIPFWLEDDTEAGGKNTVERIIKATDGVFVMNYYRDDEKKQMATEYGLAQKYGKAIWTIYELQPVGVYDLKDYNTYHDLGLQAVEENYKNMFSDTEVGLAFHTLEMMKELD